MAEEFVVNDAAVSKLLRSEVEPRMKKAMLILQGEVQRKLSKGQPVRRSKSGRQYGTTPASPAPAPPRVLSGNLRKSISNKVEVKGNEIIGTVGSNVPYARRLELGFFGVDAAGRNVNAPARPYLRTSLREQFARLVKILQGG